MKTKIYFETRSNCYYLVCSYEQRLVAKEFCFRWDSEIQAWYTPDWVKALQLSEKLELDTEGIFNFLDKPNSVRYSPKKGVLDYQKDGVRLLLANQNSLLADEQGLGKTIQVIEMVNNLKIKRVLVICPATLKLNWEKEVGVWGDSHTTHVLFSGKDTMLKDVKYIIVSYDLCNKKYISDQIYELKFDVVIFDEAHYLKNTKSKRTKTVFKLTKKIPKKVMLTGTPMINRPIELYPLVKFLSPITIEPYLDYRKFAFRFCGAFESTWGLDVTGYSNLGSLKFRLERTCLIRRLKKDVLPQLPKKIIQIIPFEQNKDTKKIIKLEKEFNIEDLKKQPKLGDIGELATIRKELALAKLPQVIKHIKDMLENVDKLVVFAYHREVCEELMEALSAYYPVLLYGGMSAISKNNGISLFQKTKTCRVFIGNIQTAGVGITLTAAHHIVFAETTWVPGEIDQAIDRCHRIGQENSVNVQFLTVKDSLDETMMKYIYDKKRILDEVLG